MDINNYKDNQEDLELSSVEPFYKASHRSPNSQLYTVCSTKRGSRYWLNWDNWSFKKEGKNNKEFDANIITAITENEILNLATLKNIHNESVKFSKFEQFNKIELGTLLYLQSDDEYYFSSNIQKIELIEINEKDESRVISEETEDTFNETFWNPIYLTSSFASAFSIQW